MEKKESIMKILFNIENVRTETTVEEINKAIHKLNKSMDAIMLLSLKYTLTFNLFF